MQFLQAIYTSAPDLLEGGGTGSLGIVAKSRDFPRDVDSDLQDHRAYTIFEDLPLQDPAVHPARYVIAKVGHKAGWICITQTIFAGADHTGRVTPLAHHLLLEPTVAAEGLLYVLRHTESAFRRAWREGPGWISPSEMPLEEWQGGPSDTFRAVCNFDPSPLLALIAQSLLDFEQNQRAVVLVAPRNLAAHVPGLIADVLRLLPPSVRIARTVATHVVETSDAPRHAALIFTYPESPYLGQHQHRQDAKAPIVVHITEPVTYATGAYAVLILVALGAADPAKAIKEAIQEWSALAGSGMSADRIGPAMELRRLLQTCRNTADLALPAQHMAVLSREPALTPHIERWCKQLLEQRFADPAIPQRWECLAAIRTDPRWPGPVRTLAADMLIAGGECALPLLIRLGSEKPSAELTADLKAIGQRKPQLIEKLLVAIGEGAGLPTARAVAAMVQAASGNVVPSIREWNQRSMLAASETRAVVLESFRLRASAQKLSAKELSDLGQVGFPGGQLDEEFVIQVYLPVALRQVINMPDADFPRISAELAAISVRVGAEQQTLDHLHRCQLTRLSPELINEWRDEVRQRFDASYANRLVTAVRASPLAYLLAPAPQFFDPLSELTQQSPRRGAGPILHAPHHDRRPPRRTRGGIWSAVYIVLLILVLMHVAAGVLAWTPIFEAEPQTWKLTVSGVSLLMTAVFVFFTFWNQTITKSGRDIRFINLILLLFLLVSSVISIGLPVRSLLRGWFPEKPTGPRQRVADFGTSPATAESRPGGDGR